MTMTDNLVLEELPITIEAAEALHARLSAGLVLPQDATRQFVEVLRGARLEAGEVSFRELGGRVSKIRSQASVNRALSLSNPKFARWAVVKAILVDGLGAGEETERAVKRVWILAQHVGSGRHQASA